MSAANEKFIFGLMGSGKTEHLVCKRDEIDQSSTHSILIVPSVCKARKLSSDQKENFLYSRSGKNTRIDLWVETGLDLFSEILALVGSWQNVGFIFVDEVQFLSIDQVDQILKFARDPFNQNIVLYGLKNNYLAQTFEASDFLVEKLGIERCFEVARPICSCGRAFAECDALCRHDGNLVSAKFVHVCTNCVMNKSREIVDAVSVYSNLMIFKTD